MNRVLIVLAGLLTLGCDGGEKKDGLTLGAGAGADECALTFDGLDGSEWLYLDVNPADKSEFTNHTKGRLKFVKEGGDLIAKYNVGSLSNVYDYICEEKGEELICRQRLTDAEVELWCRAFLANGQECSLANFQKEAPSITEDQIKEGVKKAKEGYATYEKNKTLDNFKLQYNNLGTKLMGIMYIKIETRKCRIRVTDMYKTYYNEKWIEDSNPNGINPFVKNEEGEMNFKNCDNPLDLVDLRSADYPSDPANVKNITRHPAGTEVHYWFLGGDYQKAEEGCEYSYTRWTNNKAPEKGLKPETADGGALRWHYAKKYEDVSKPGEAEVITLDITKTCSGKDPVNTVACNAVLITPAE
ncbi:MAG: hypothetical protein AAFV53_13130 [Myxococcota bacterium]